jgi:hypothetical protein
VSPVKYELVSYFPEGGILHSHRRGNTKCYKTKTVRLRGSASRPLVLFTHLRQLRGPTRCYFRSSNNHLLSSWDLARSQFVPFTALLTSHICDSLCPLNAFLLSDHPMEVARNIHHECSVDSVTLCYDWCAGEHSCDIDTFWMLVCTS